MDNHSFPNNFSIVDIPYYTNLTSVFSNSIYSFSSVESMMLFKNTGNRLKKESSIQRLLNGQYDGIPLFQCQLKKDKSFFLFNNECNNLIIYKYIVIPTDSSEEELNALKDTYLKNREYKFVCENSFHKISIYKIVYSEIKNKTAVLAISNDREYTLKFRQNLIKMVFKYYNDYVEVDNGQFPKSRWIYNDNIGNIIIDGFFINDNYKLVQQDGSVSCEYDNTDRSNKWITYTKSEKMGVLRIQDSINPPSLSSNMPIKYHNNSFFDDFNEKIMCMTFVLITFKKYKNQEIRRKHRRLNNNIGGMPYPF